MTRDFQEASNALASLGKVVDKHTFADCEEFIKPAAIDESQLDQVRS